MRSKHVALAPDKMSDDALWRRAHRLVERAHYVHGATPRERDDVLDELARVLEELQMRGTQLALFR